MRRRISVLAIAAALFASAADAQDVTPHRALYEISLAGPSDMFASARGLAATEVKRTCSGWRFSQRFELETVPVEGEPSRAVLLLDATEGAEGESYAFRSTNDYGGDGSFELVGNAKLGPDGGMVRYTEPAPVQMPLPPGTGFAISSVRQALQAARAGAKQHRGHWFVGSTPDEPMLVNSLIAPAETPTDAVGLWAGKRWRFLAAFFSTSDETVPLYEGGETLTEQGVLIDAVYEYDGYGLKLTLVRLEPSPPPEC